MGMDRLPETVWKSMRLEYQSTKTTCRALAEKYGVNPMTVSNRCKVEKWRFGRHEPKKRRSRATNQLVPAPLTPQQLSERIQRESELWLDRIQEAYEKEVRYDRVEAIQKLLPQWKNTVEQIQKRSEQEPPKQSDLRVDVAFLSYGKLPPLLHPPPREDATDLEVVEVESSAPSRNEPALLEER